MLAFVASMPPWESSPSYEKAEKFAKVWPEIHAHLMQDRERSVPGLVRAQARTSKFSKGATKVMDEYRAFFDTFINSPASEEIFPIHLLELIDSMYVKHLRPHKAGFGSFGYKRWMLAMKKYWDELEEVCREAWEARKEVVMKTTKRMADVEALEYAEGKLKWVRWLTEHGVMFCIPLPTRSAIEDMVEHVQSMGWGIFFVSVHVYVA